MLIPMLGPTVPRVTLLPLASQMKLNRLGVLPRLPGTLRAILFCAFK